jgi:GGDEF domain-containing protein
MTLEDSAATEASLVSPHPIEDEIDPEEQELRDKLQVSENARLALEQELRRVKSSRKELGHELGGHLIRQAVAEDIQNREQERAAELRVDPLTGLYTKQALRERVEDAIGVAEIEGIGEEDFGIITIDLSSFNNVNYALGHPAGDKVLQRTARMLKETLRSKRDIKGDEMTHFREDYIGHALLEPTDTEEAQASREGGDEFTVLAFLTSDDETDIRGNTDRLKIIQDRITSSFKDMLEVMAVSHDPDEVELAKNLREVGFGIAVGGAVWKRGMTPDELYEEADNDMFKDKDKRKREIVELLDLGSREKLKQFIGLSQDPDLRPVLTQLGYRSAGLDKLMPKEPEQEA